MTVFLVVVILVLTNFATWMLTRTLGDTSIEVMGAKIQRLGDSVKAVEDRMAAVEKSVVASVMEENGLVDPAVIIKTTKDLTNMGVLPSAALSEAKKLHGVK